MYKLFEALFGSKRIEYEYSVQVYFEPECDLIDMKEIKIWEYFNYTFAFSVADFVAFGTSLNRTGRPIVYYCEWPMYAKYYGQEASILCYR